MLPGNLLHPWRLDVVGFKEEDHDYHFRVELPEPTCCQSCGYADEKPGKYGKDVPISTVMRIIETGEL